MKSKSFIQVSLIAVICGIIFLALHNRKIIRVPGRIITGPDSVTTNLINSWSTNEYTENLSPQAIQVALDKRLMISTLNSATNSATKLTLEQQIQLTNTVLACFDYLSAPSWNKYRSLKFQGNYQTHLGKVTSTFMAYWMKDAIKDPVTEKTIQQLWSFVYENDSRKPAPILVGVSEGSIKIDILERTDADQVVFDVNRRMYDGLVARALDDTVSFSEKADSNGGKAAANKIACVSCLCKTVFDDKFVPLTFALRWDPSAKIWWPAALVCSHPAFVPVF